MLRPGQFSTCQTKSMTSAYDCDTRTAHMYNCDINVLRRSFPQFVNVLYPDSASANPDANPMGVIIGLRPSARPTNWGYPATNRTYYHPPLVMAGYARQISAHSSAFLSPRDIASLNGHG
jgi:hypothetical protein